MARAVPAVLLAALLASSALANPIADEWFTVDFDPPNGIPYVTPLPYTNVRAYFVLDLRNRPTQEFSAVSFSIDVVPWQDTPAPLFTTLHQSAILEGDWREGVTIAFSECIGASDVVAVAAMDFFYLDGSFDVLIQEHPDYERCLLDCSDPPVNLVYCVLYHGAIGKTDFIQPSLSSCAASPVESHSWGSIKSMYR